MKKLFYLGFCLVLMAGVGCAISDYQIITDNDQLLHGQQSADATVNTNGKAHIRSFQIASIFGDGADEAINFVDQKSNGDRTLTAYDNFSTFGGPGPTFHDDLYCNPDWTGCAAWTATDPPGGYDRSGAGFPAFDGRFNPNCRNGLQRIFSTTRQRRGYYNDGECGRGNGLAERLALMNAGTLGTHELTGQVGLFYYLDANNTTYMVNGNLIPFAQTNVFMNWKARQAFVDMTNPLHAVSMNAVASVCAPQTPCEFELRYNGISLKKTLFGIGPWNARAKTAY